MIYVFDPERRSREPDAQPERDPSGASVIVLPVMRIERGRGGLAEGEASLGGYIENGKFVPTHVSIGPLPPPGTAKRGPEPSLSQRRPR